MGRPSLMIRRSAAALVLLAAVSCSPDTDPAVSGTGPSPASAGPGPLTAELSQFRDNYSRQIIEIQLTNTTGAAVTVLAARLQSPLFASGPGWTPAGAGTELPPGQTKSLPARLPAASCPGPAEHSSPSPEQSAVVEVRLADAAGAPAKEFTLPANDPFGVLVRNNAEMCVAQATDAIAGFRFSPDLQLSADARSAVVRLVIAPRNAASAGPGAGTLTINSIGATTLLDEDPSAPWPRGLRVDAAGPVRDLSLGLRPARCDPHAVAEDKVGTLIPLRVTVAGREGVLKIDAGALLRGRIYDFVTAACGRQ